MQSIGGIAPSAGLRLVPKTRFRVLSENSVAEVSRKVEMQPFVEWSRRIRGSDANAFAELFDHASGPLLGYVRRVTGDEDAAVDIVQETFARLWQNRERLDPEGSLRGFMYQIARNLAYDHIKMKKKQVSEGEVLHLAVAEAPPDQELSAKRLGEVIGRWVGELPERRQEAFRLSRFEGLTHDEIAQIMGLTVRTVTNHIMSSLQFLRQRLAAYESGEV